MSGHSKFANINHKKEKNDAKKGKIFTVIGREIVVAVKEGGPDPANNSKLRDVIAKAKANNMPNDTIERGIKKAAGDANADNFEKLTYEGYGPSGVAIIVETLTDNKNRTAGNVRSAGIYQGLGERRDALDRVAHVFQHLARAEVERAARKVAFVVMFLYKAGSHRKAPVVLVSLDDDQTGVFQIVFVF